MPSVYLSFLQFDRLLIAYIVNRSSYVWCRIIGCIDGEAHCETQCFYWKSSWQLCLLWSCFSTVSWYRKKYSCLFTGSHGLTRQHSFPFTSPSAGYTSTSQIRDKCIRSSGAYFLSSLCWWYSPCLSIERWPDWVDLCGNAQWWFIRTYFRAGTNRAPTLTTLTYTSALTLSQTANNWGLQCLFPFHERPKYTLNDKYWCNMIT